MLPQVHLSLIPKLDSQIQSLSFGSRILSAGERVTYFPACGVAFALSLASVGLAGLGAVGLRAAGQAQTIHGRDGIILPPPPTVEAAPVSDDYFSTRIPDSYRWLEDRSEERRVG